MNENLRTERDSIGTLAVPEDAYYGVQSLRAYRNFRITGQGLHPFLIQNIVRIKKAAAIVNEKIGRLDPQKAQAILAACDEILNGAYADAFIVDAVQGGAGTSANMNVNEVIANRAIEILGGRKGDYSVVHPNDHVNLAQSTNDVIPTAGKMTVIDLMQPLLLSIHMLALSFDGKAKEFDDIVKLGPAHRKDGQDPASGRGPGPARSGVRGLCRRRSPGHRPNRSGRAGNARRQSRRKRHRYVYQRPAGVSGKYYARALRNLRL